MPDMNLPIDVAERPVPTILKVSANLSPHHLIDSVRYAEALRLADRLQARGQVDIVAIDVTVFPR